MRVVQSRFSPLARLRRYGHPKRVQCSQEERIGRDSDVVASTKRHVRAGATALLLAYLALSPAVPADAAERAVARRAANFATDHAGITRAHAVGEVRRLFDGRILSATAVERGGRLGYRVRLLTDEGRVRNVYVDSGGVRPEG